MKFIIHYGQVDEIIDEIIIEGETLAEAIEIAFQETEKRGWDKSKCWSEQIED